MPPREGHRAAIEFLWLVRFSRAWCLLAPTFSNDTHRFSWAGGHVHGTYGVESAFSFDDAFVVSGSEDGAALVWDLVGANLHQRLEHRSSYDAPGAERQKAAGDRAVVGVAPHPKGKGIMTTALDGAVVFWEGGI